MGARQRGRPVVGGNLLPATALRQRRGSPANPKGHNSLRWRSRPQAVVSLQGQSIEFDTHAIEINSNKGRSRQTNHEAFYEACGLQRHSARRLPSDAHALTLYDNSASQTGNRYNPQNSSSIAFDDVVVNSSLLNVLGQNSSSILLDSVTVGIRRISPAPATTIDVYAASFVDGFLNTSINLNTATIQKIGSFSLSSTGTNVLSPLTLNFAAASRPKIGVQYFNSNAYFAIGLSFSDTSVANGWRINNYTSDPAGTAFTCSEGSSATNANGQGPLNLGCFWRYESSTQSANIISGYTGNLGAAQYTIVAGIPTPVPGPLPVLGGVTAFGMSRRLRARIKTASS